MSDPTEDKTPAASPAPTHGRRMPGTAFWVFLTFVVGALIVYLSFLRQVERTVDKTTGTVDKVIDTAKGAAVELVKLFQPEEVIKTFHEWRELTVASGTGSHLEIATAEASERFSRTTNFEVFGKKLPMSTSVSEITVPATYRFHIDLNDDWNLTSDGKRLVVRAPRVRPTLPVAFDTGRVEKKTSSGWVRWDADDDLADLEKGITGELAIRAADPDTIAKIEDEGRIAVARFVRTWLLTREAWGDGRFEEIVVIFEGEEESPDVLPQTLRFELGKEVLP
jgi:hypothetical protein